MLIKYASGLVLEGMLISLRGSQLRVAPKDSDDLSHPGTIGIDRIHARVARSRAVGARQPLRQLRRGRLPGISGRLNNAAGPESDRGPAETDPAPAALPSAEYSFSPSFESRTTPL